MTEAELTQMKADYERDGVAVLRGLLSNAEIKLLQEEVERLWQTQAERKAQNLRLALRRDYRGDWTLDRLDPVADISPVFLELNHDPRLLAIAQTLLDCEVTVLKEKIIYKRPGVEGFGFHRDGPYFGSSGVPAGDMLSLCIAIDPTNVENGATEFYPQLRLKELVSEPGEPRDIAESELDQRYSIKPLLLPGDAVMFDDLVPHRSAMNHSGQSRCTYFVTYAPANYSDCRKRYYRNREIEEARVRAREFPGPFFVIDADNQRRLVEHDR